LTPFPSLNFDPDELSAYINQRDYEASELGEKGLISLSKKRE